MKIKIGTEVAIDKIVEFFYDEEGNRTYKYIKVNKGPYYVTGVRNIPLGKYVGGRGYSDMDGDEYIPPYLDVKSTVKVCLVSKALSRKSVMILYDDIVNTPYECTKIVTFFDDESTRAKLDVMFKIDAIEDDDRNPYWGDVDTQSLEDFLQIGKKYKLALTVEEVE